MANFTVSNSASKVLPLAEQYARGRSAVLVKELGSGGSASVFLLDYHGKQTALKVYAPHFFDEKNGPAERRRIELQRQLIGHDCTTLIGIRDVVLEAGTCFIEMEYVDWRCLKDVIALVPNDKVEILFSQLLDAVKYFDERGLVHRDIKPENILVDTCFENLKLIDFGVMREAGAGEDGVDATDHGLRRPFIASAQYSSPEYLFRLKEPSVEMWRALTIYQLGGVLHDLLMKRPLFDNVVRTDNKFALAMSVLTAVPDFGGVSDDVRQWAALAAHCLVKDPELRLALVDLSRLRPAKGSGVERLKLVIEQRKLIRVAQGLQETKLAQVRQARHSELDSLQTEIRKKFITVVDKAYGLVVNQDGDARITFDVSIGSDVKLSIDCHFDWVSELTPFLANVALTATIGLVHEERRKKMAVGQLVVGGSMVSQLSDDILSAICAVLAAVVEQQSLGASYSGQSSLDALSLIQ